MLEENCFIKFGLQVLSFETLAKFVLAATRNFFLLQVHKVSVLEREFHAFIRMVMSRYPTKNCAHLNSFTMSVVQFQMPNQFTSCLLHLLITSELQNLTNNIALFTAMGDVYSDNQWTVKYQVD